MNVHKKPIKCSLCVEIVYWVEVERENGWRLAGGGVGVGVQEKGEDRKIFIYLFEEICSPVVRDLFIRGSLSLWLSISSSLNLQALSLARFHLAPYEFITSILNFFYFFVHFSRLPLIRLVRKLILNLS